MANEYTKKGVEELQKMVGDMREELRTFRFGGAGSRTRDVRHGRNLRRDIARILTELRSRDIGTTEGIASSAKNA
jgi:ribosomal protein L29